MYIVYHMWCVWRMQCWCDTEYFYDLAECAHVCGIFFSVKNVMKCCALPGVAVARRPEKVKNKCKTMTRFTKDSHVKHSQRINKISILRYSSPNRTNERASGRASS